MTKSPLDGSRADRRGMLIASLCFLHCVAGPVLLSFAGMASLAGASERLEPRCDAPSETIPEKTRASSHSHKSRKFKHCDARRANSKRSACAGGDGGGKLPGVG